MTHMAVKDVREAFADVVNRVMYQGERIILQRYGKDVAVIIPLDDFALLQAIEDQIDLQDARTALAEAREKGTLAWDTLKAELGL
jgi:prevent-host-death family protein